MTAKVGKLSSGGCNSRSIRREHIVCKDVVEHQASDGSFAWAELHSNILVESYECAPEQRAQLLRGAEIVRMIIWTSDG